LLFTHKFTIKFVNKTANIKYKKLTSLHYCVRRPSHTSKTAEIILLGHGVIERRMCTEGEKSKGSFIFIKNFVVAQNTKIRYDVSCAVSA